LFGQNSQPRDLNRVSLFHCRRRFDARSGPGRSTRGTFGTFSEEKIKLYRDGLKPVPHPWSDGVIRHCLLANQSGLLKHTRSLINPE
jgi:hypothetical protein